MRCVLAIALMFVCSPAVAQWDDVEAAIETAGPDRVYPYVESEFVEGSTVSPKAKAFFTTPIQSGYGTSRIRIRLYDPDGVLRLDKTGPAEAVYHDPLPAPNGDGHQDVYVRSYQPLPVLLLAAGEWTVRVTCEQLKSPGWAECFPIHGGRADYQHKFSVAPASGQ